MKNLNTIFQKIIHTNKKVTKYIKKICAFFYEEDRIQKIPNTTNWLQYLTNKNEEFENMWNLLYTFMVWHSDPICSSCSIYNNCPYKSNPNPDDDWNITFCTYAIVAAIVNKTKQIYSPIGSLNSLTYWQKLKQFKTNICFNEGGEQSPSSFFSVLVKIHKFRG